MTGSVAELCANPAVGKHYLTSLTLTAREGKLKGFEVFKALHLEPVQFSVEVWHLTLCPDPMPVSSKILTGSL